MTCMNPLLIMEQRKTVFCVRLMECQIYLIYCSTVLKVEFDLVANKVLVRMLYFILLLVNLLQNNLCVHDPLQNSSNL